MLQQVTDQQKSPIPSHQRARGVGELTVVDRNGLASIERLYQEGCAKIRVPKARSNTLESVMINTSGGMTGGDRLDWVFVAEENTKLSVTTQACERVYKSSGGTAHMNVSLDVHKTASLHWLPQETILFDKCSLQRTITVNMSTESELLMVEPLVFGRQAMGETNINGYFHDRWRVNRSGHLIHTEDFILQNNIAEQLSNPFIGDGNAASATVLLVAPRAEMLLQDARTLLQDSGGVSYWNGKLLARVLAKDSYELRQHLYPLMRLLGDGKPLPKIWAN